MGVFDKVVKDAEEAMARDDPGLAQQAGQPCGQAGQDMQAAQHLIGKQRGAHDQSHDQDRAPGSDQGGDDQDDSDEDW
jgi:hypothetical protein